jgi:hypothetical protein
MIVVSAPLFPHRLTKGYSNPAGRVLRALNGTKPKNLNHLVELLRTATSEFLEFTFEGQGTETLIFNRQELLTVTEDILSDNDIRARGTPDTMAAWNNGGK